MKRALFITFLVAAISWSGAAWASTMYYTLTGTVSSVRDSAGLAGQAGISIGDTLSYTVAINTDSIGGQTNPWQSWTMGSNSYWAESYSGNLQGDTIGSGRTMDNYVRVEGNEDWWSRRVVYAGDNYSNIYFQDAGGMQTGFDDWTVGTVLSSLSETAYSGWSSSSVVLNSATITRVSSSAPTPVPAAVWLMGMGIAGLGIIRRKRTS